MLFRLLLSSNGGFIAGVAIEAVLTVTAIVLLILVLRYGLPKLEPKERAPREPKQPKQPKPAPEKYILKYAAGEGSGESPALEQYAKGAKIILKANMFTTPAGKLFDGWSDGEKKYEANKKFIMPAQAVTLTAQWIIPEAKYTLRYVAGEATGEEPMVECYYKGEKVVLKTNMFVTPSGKQFDGWSDGENKYASKFTYVMPAQPVTFTAQWAEVKKDEPVEEPVVKAAPQPAKEEVKVDVTTTEQPAQQIDGGTTADGRPIVVNVYTPANTEKTIEKEIIHTVEKKDDDEPNEEDGMFANYTILELYGLLSDEQKKYFDTLKEAALAKPQAKLSAARNFLNIKIGKRSILKLRIRRLVTVGEYALENDILRDFRKSSDNKAGNAKIKVRPTLVAVTDDATLETALSMIDLVHKQILES